MLLFLESNVKQGDFWKVMVLQELAGVWKNSGLREYAQCILRIRSDPFKDPELILMMLKRGMVDTMSETLSAISIFVMFSVESLILPYTPMVNVTRFALINGTTLDKNNIIWEYAGPNCVITCPGWNGAERPGSHAKMPLGELLVVIAIVLLLRLVFMMLERYFLSNMKEYLDNKEDVGEEDTQTNSHKTIRSTTKEAGGMFNGVPWMFVAVASFSAISGASGGIQSLVWSGLDTDYNGEKMSVEFI